MKQSTELKHYFRRIGYDGSPRPDYETLRAVHQLQNDAVTYENLDVQLGRRVGRDLAPIFEKIVAEGRGGWCYEQNELLGWALSEIGFQVTQHAGGVARDVNGQASVGNHLVLIVDLDQRYLADCGFGDGIVEPLPLAVGTYTQRGLGFALSRTTDGWWRFHNHAHGAATDFDFREEIADQTLLDRKCDELQTDPQSGFVLNAVCQRYQPDAHYTLRGRVLKTLRDGAFEQRLVSDLDEYEETLRTIFALRVPEAGRLWPKIVARHEVLFPAA
ncbi:MAG: arylamine N-acetyltransferase [Rhizobiales bacterium]|nr:arylamine N-acetyltransferase [Hyphomicrobiales bacterium]